MSEFAPGSTVILEALPDGLIEGLPEEDVAAIEAMVGQPVMLVGYSFGQAELTFLPPACSMLAIGYLFAAFATPTSMVMQGFQPLARAT